MVSNCVVIFLSPFVFIKSSHRSSSSCDDRLSYRNLALFFEVGLRRGGNAYYCDLGSIVEYDVTFGLSPLIILAFPQGFFSWLSDTLNFDLTGNNGRGTHS